jgi:hypothetical protein
MVLQQMQLAEEGVEVEARRVSVAGENDGCCLLGRGRFCAVNVQ